MKVTTYTNAQALDHALKMLVANMGGEHESAARLYLEVQTFLTDYAWKTRGLK